MKISVKINSIECSEIEYLEKGQAGNKSNKFITEQTPRGAKTEKGIQLTIPITMEVLKAESGDRCQIKCITQYDIETDFDMNAKVSSDTSIMIVSELTIQAIAHTRMLFIERAKDTIFKGVILPYKSLSEIIQHTKETIFSILN